jgi:hypothetical protein
VQAPAIESQTPGFLVTIRTQTRQANWRGHDRLLALGACQGRLRAETVERPVSPADASS